MSIIKRYSGLLRSCFCPLPLARSAPLYIQFSFFFFCHGPADGMPGPMRALPPSLSSLQCTKPTLNGFQYTDAILQAPRTQYLPPRLPPDPHVPNKNSTISFRHQLKPIIISIGTITLSSSKSNLYLNRCANLKSINLKLVLHFVRCMCNLCGCMCVKSLFEMTPV